MDKHLVEGLMSRLGWGRDEAQAWIREMMKLTDPTDQEMYDHWDKIPEAARPSMFRMFGRIMAEEEAVTSEEEPDDVLGFGLPEGSKELFRVKSGTHEEMSKRVQIRLGPGGLLGREIKSLVQINHPDDEVVFWEHENKLFATFSRESFIVYANSLLKMEMTNEA